MVFLETESGSLIAATSLIRIGALNTRPHIARRWHDVEYRAAKELRSTTASALAVLNLLSECDEA